MSARRGYLHRLQRWWHSPLARVALVLGIGVHLAGFLLFRVVTDPVCAAETPKPFIVWNGPEGDSGNIIRREQALLLDSEALFLPTALNARSENTSLRLLSPGAALLELDTPLPVTVDLFSANGDGTASDAALTVERLLARYSRERVSTYGQAKPSAPAQTPDRAQVAVREASTGRLLQTFTLDTGEALLPVPAEPEPLEFMLYRSGPGDVGSLLPLTPAAGGEAGKAWARQIERADWEITLPQGYYRLVVSP